MREPDIMAKEKSKEVVENHLSKERPTWQPKTASVRTTVGLMVAFFADSRQ